MYIADCGNDRIVEWKCSAARGQIVSDGNRQDNKINQLYFPRDVIIDKENNSFIISDQKNRRVIRWSRQNNTNEQILISDVNCFGLKLDKNGSLYVSNWKSNKVRRRKRGDRNGTIVAGGSHKVAEMSMAALPLPL